MRAANSGRGDVRTRLVLVAVGSFCLWSSSIAATEPDQVRELIKHADTYYWLGMQEGGNIQAFERGLQFLDEAEGRLGSKSIAEEEKHALDSQIANSRIDLEQQKEIFLHRFYGAFPLVRLLKPSLFSDENVTGSYVLVDNPEAVAVRRTVGSLCKEVFGFWYQYPQFNVVFTSVPHNVELENEALFTFNLQDRFYVQNLRAVGTVLTPEELIAFQSGIVSPQAMQKMCDAFGVPYLLAVVVRELDKVDGIVFVQAEGYFYHSAGGKIDHTILKFIATRDKRTEFWEILTINVLLLILAIVLYGFVYRRKPDRDLSHIKLLFVPIASFAVGRFLPWFILPAIAAFQPEPETTFRLSFWWTLIMGAALFLGPALFYKLFSVRLAKYFPVLNVDGQGGGVFAIVAMGVCGYLAGPEILVQGSSAWPSIALMTAAGAATCFVLGKSLDRSDPFPMSRTVVSVVLAPVLGYAICTSSSLYAAASAVVALLAAILTLTWKSKDPQTLGNVSDGEFKKHHIKDHSAFFQRLKDPQNFASAHILGRISDEVRTLVVRHEEPSNQLMDALAGDLNDLVHGPQLFTGRGLEHLKLPPHIQDLLSQNPRGRELLQANRVLLCQAFPEIEWQSGLGSLPRDEIELIERTQDPPYVPPAAFSQSMQRLEPDFFSGGTLRIGVFGVAGVGKTRLSREIAIQLMELGQAGSKRKVTFMAGTCPEPLDGQSAKTSAYAPFQTILSDHFGIDLRGNAQTELKQVDTALEGLFEAVVPFAGLLFPAEEDSVATASSREEIARSVVQMLHRILEKSSVILFIDDLQWIDDSSFDLLKHILNHFQPGGRQPLLVIVASRERKVLEELGIKDEIIELKSLGVEERCDLLHRSLGLEARSAKALVNQIDGSESKQGELFWLFQAVAYLGRSGSLRKTEDGFALTDELLKSGSLPVPEGLQTILVEQLAKFPQHRALLECAACASEGVEFSAEVVAESLGKSVLVTLQELQSAEDQTGFVCDLRKGDYRFAFRSSILLSVVREELKILGSGPLSSGVPQVIREYHARIANSLEGTLDKSSHELYNVAKQYYAAGRAHTEKALQYCLEAAHAASVNFSHDLARDFLAMGRECASSLNREGELEEELLMIELDEAFVVGRALGEAAQRALNHISSHDAVSTIFLLRAARACFDAGTQDQEMFVRAKSLAERVVRTAREPLEIAEAYHFAGISLPPHMSSEIREKLEQSLKILEGKALDGRVAQLLYCRVLNSLANALSSGSPPDRQRAKELFEKRLELNDKYALGDKPGVVRTYGGLGRLALTSKPPDLQTAIQFFSKDLELSVVIQDMRGQVQMHSRLGECYGLLGDHLKAVGEYQNSYALSENLRDKMYAAAGLFNSYCALNDSVKFNSLGKELLAQMGSGAPPADPAEKLRKVLQDCAISDKGDWVGALLSRIS